MIPSQIVDYKEPTWGCISNVKFPKDHSCDNALLFSATYICLLDDPLSDKNTFLEFATACQVEPGLYNRYPGDNEPEAWDDFIGVVAASIVLKRNLHQEILAWGQDHNWTWCNSNPKSETLSSFLGRYPAFPCFLQMASGITPSPADELLFIAACESSALTPVGNESGKCLQYLMNRMVLGKRPEVDLSIWLWKQMMKSKYPGGMKEVYANYFGPLHPFSQFGPTNFE
jgi:hypothetical protein